MTLIHNWMWYSWFTPKSHSLVCACSWQPPGWLSLHHVGPRDWAQVKSALAAPIPPAPFTFAISLIWNRLSFYVLWYPPCHETFNNWLIACLLPRLASLCVAMWLTMQLRLALNHWSPFLPPPPMFLKCPVSLHPASFSVFHLVLGRSCGWATAFGNWVPESPSQPQIWGLSRRPLTSWTQSRYVSAKDFQIQQLLFPFSICVWRSCLTAPRLFIAFIWWLIVIIYFGW